MSQCNRRGLLNGAAIVLGASLVATAAYAQNVIYVPTAPPPPRVEVIPPPPANQVETWQKGYWRWDGQQYAWNEGHYVAAPRTGAVWTPGAWEQRPEGWVYVQGHWN
jgi:hypothetical protein